MTTNVFDCAAGMMATDSRWSIIYGNFLIYLDDVRFEKIEVIQEHAFMFAGRGDRVQEWKNWIRTNPTSPLDQPDHDGLVVCMIKVHDKQVVFSSGKTTNYSGSIFAGSGADPAFVCWSKNKDAKLAVESAKRADYLSGGDVKFFNFNNRENNLFFPGGDVTYADLVKHLSDRGLVMTTTKAIAPFPLKAAMAANEELKDVPAKIASGEIRACAPCEGMDAEWTQEEKEKFNAALGEAFGWSKK